MVGALGGRACRQSVSNLSFVSGRVHAQSLKIVGRLVDAGALLLELHQQVVCELCSRQKPEPDQRREPRLAERFAQHDEVMDRLLGLRDAGRRASCRPCGRSHGNDRGSPAALTSCDGHRRGGLDLAGGGLGEIRTGVDRAGCLARRTAVERAELAGLENDLEVRAPQASLTATISSNTRWYSPAKRAAGDHPCRSRRRLLATAMRVSSRLDRKRRHAAGNGGRHRRHLDVVTLERPARHADHCRVDAHAPQRAAGPAARA